METKLPFLHAERSRFGVTYYYVRVNRGRRIRIKGDFGTPEFLAHYHEVIATEAPPPREANPSVHPGSFGWLVTEWLKSAEWSAAAPATQSQRKAFLDQVVATLGDVPLRGIKRQQLLDERNHRRETPCSANNLVKTLRALFQWAHERGLVEENHAHRVPFIKIKSPGYRPWTMEEVETYRNCWPLGTRQRVALEVLLNTGLRRGDAIRLGPQHVADGVASIRTEKTRMEVHIPILPTLQEAIQKGPIGDTTYIARWDGKPMGRDSFSMWFHEACTVAGVPGSAHGLRKTAATMMAEAGGSERELMAFFGWSTTSQSQVYTREADKRLLAARGAERMRDMFMRQDR